MIPCQKGGSQVKSGAVSAGARDSNLEVELEEASLLELRSERDRRDGGVGDETVVVHPPEVRLRTTNHIGKSVRMLTLASAGRGGLSAGRKGASWGSAVTWTISSHERRWMYGAPSVVLTCATSSQPGTQLCSAQAGPHQSQPKSVKPGRVPRPRWQERECPW